MANYQPVPSESGNMLSNNINQSYGGTDSAPTGGPSSKRLQQTQAQVDEVVDIMRTNVDKVLERDQKLSELDDRADALQQGASQFETQAAKLKRKYWWKNCKMIIMLSVVIIIIIAIIVNVGHFDCCYFSDTYYYHSLLFYQMKSVI
uniref:vesicle-associated membrane protein 3-like isoform X3 n=1 Tax=Styela clava TaxID=7725 RepID=UPI00193ADFB2|nr:vesicle-associated membrane protein 3-like isoform X3 [Styela clava]